MHANKTKPPCAGIYRPNKEAVMPAIIRNAHFDPEHGTARQAEVRKFEISKHRAEICKHVERTIANGLTNCKFARPTNESMREKIAASKAKLEKQNELHRQGLNLKTGASS